MKRSANSNRRSLITSPHDSRPGSRPGRPGEPGARLGTPLPWPYARKMEGFPEITELIQEPDDKYAFGGSWHSDSCNFERPPKYTMAYAVACPPVGGDTAFSNQYLAWETLDEALRTELASVRCVNSSALGYGTASIDREVTGNTATPILYSEGQFNEVLHPICRTHPVTGRKALYTNDSFTARFEGRSQQESLPLLRRLWRHSITPEFTCRLSWKPKSPGDLGQPLLPPLRPQRLPRPPPPPETHRHRRRTAVLAAAQAWRSDFSELAWHGDKPVGLLSAVSRSMSLVSGPCFRAGAAVCPLLRRRSDRGRRCSLPARVWFLRRKSS